MSDRSSAPPSPVPLDYDRPRGATISIALTRLPATDPARRIGSLFLNPGGPGGSGVDFVVGAGPFLYTDEVRARFDLVGFDPRGIMRSTALRCFDSPEEWEPYFTPFAFPMTREEERIVDRGGSLPARPRASAAAGRSSTTCRRPTSRATSTSCARRSATASSPTPATRTARTSATPTRTCSPTACGRVVLDGVLDPIAWSTGAAGSRARRCRSRRGCAATPARRRR